MPMPDHIPPSTETPRVVVGTMTDAATGQVVGRIWQEQEDKTRDGRLAKAAAVGRVRARWNKRDFRVFQNGLTQARRDKDAAALQKAFAEAADIPIFKEALDWAREHGIDFFVDRTCTKQVGAYYTGGIGAVGIALSPVMADPWLFWIPALLVGVGQGISLPLLIATVSEEAPPEQRGVALGMRQTANQFGMTFAPVGLGAIAASAGLLAGFVATAGVSIGLLALGYWMHSTVRRA
jgi:hypothetical protein